MGRASIAQWELDDDQCELVASVRRAAELTLVPLAADHAASGDRGHVDRRLVRAMGDLGLLRRLFPGVGDGTEPHRGPHGADQPGVAAGARTTDRPSVAALDLCLMREGLATVCTEAETALALQGLGTYPLVLAGSSELVRRWLPEVVAGTAVAGFALSEAGAGSDAGALALRAEPDGERAWRLSGEKLWISNAPEADFYSVFARTAAGGPRGVTAFAVPADRPGLSGAHLDMLSPHPIGSLRFDGVPVTEADLLGRPEQGFSVAMRTLDLFRPSVGAFGVGIAQAAFDAAMQHAASRQAFGAPLKEMQSVAHTLAEMKLRIEAARLMVYRAGAAYDDGRPTVSTTSAMAKLLATETAQWVVDQAIQIHGARALQRGHLLEHLYREVRAPRIYEGASEVQRSIIARDLFRGDAATEDRSGEPVAAELDDGGQEGRASGI